MHKTYNRMNLRSMLSLKYIILTLLTLVMVGCASRKNIVYFQGEATTIDQLAEKYSPKIQPDDMLVITVSARDFEATKLFNQVNYYYQREAEGRLVSFLVDAEGYIEYPVIGKIQLGGLTRSEAMTKMKSLLAEYIVDPGVTISIANFRITVLGEVNTPGTFTLTNEKISILEALGLAGDLTINGVRNNVKVIREVEGKKEIHNVDLTSNQILNSPVYYLKQNDVVYVEPNKAQIQSSTYSRNTSVIISIASLLITVISVLTR